MGACTSSVHKQAPDTNAVSSIQPAPVTVADVFHLQDVYGTPLPPPVVTAPGRDADVLQRIGDRVRGRVPCIPVCAPGAPEAGPALCACAPCMPVGALCVALGRVFACLGAMRTVGVVHLGICPRVLRLPSCSWTAAAAAAAAATATPNVLLTNFAAGGLDAGVAGARTHLISAPVQATLHTVAAVCKRTERVFCNVYIPPEVTLYAMLKTGGEGECECAPVIAHFRAWLSTCAGHWDGKRESPLEAVFQECEAAMVKHTSATQARWREALATADDHADQALARIEVEVVAAWDVYSLAVATLYALLVRHDVHDPLLARAVTLLLTKVCAAPLHERATLSCHCLGKELVALGGWQPPAARLPEPTEVAPME